MIHTKLANVCPVFVTENIVDTVEFYINKLGFKYVKHYDKIDNFATLYRDSIELVIIQSKYGKVESNSKRYGVGYDIYIDPESIDGVDELYDEFQSKGVNIIKKPFKTDYGSYEFVIEDIDGRYIGIGLIADNKVYFKTSNYLES